MIEDTEDFVCRNAAGRHVWIHPDYPNREWSAENLLDWAKDHELPPGQLREVIRVAAILLRLNTAGKS